MKITTGQKVAAAFGLAALPLLVMGWFSYQTPRQFIRLTDSCRRSQQIIERLAAFLSDMKDLETGQRGYLLTRKATYLSPFLDAKTTIARELQELNRFAAENGANQSRLAKLESLVHFKIAELERTIDLRRNDRQNGFNKAVKIVQTDEGKEFMDEIRAVVADMQREEETRRDERLSEAAAASQRLVWVASAVSPATVVLMGLSVLLILRDLSARAAPKPTSADNGPCSKRS